MSLESEQSFEDLLGRAEPRPAPSRECLETARNAVRAEWRAATDARRRKRRLVFAVAASVALGLAVVLDLSLKAPTEAVQIATIEASNGTIYLLGETSGLESIAGRGTVLTGQTIETAAGASLALRWPSGVSLRVDEGTRIRFETGGRIKLAKGRVYFDSQTTTDGRLLIRTRHGDVSHLGTQYMVAVDDEQMAVSVRQGRVFAEGHFHDEIAAAGQRLTFVDSRPPRLEAIAGYGGDWLWVEATSPPVYFDGRHIIELLQWASQETGLTMEYSSAAVEQTVRREVLTGDYDRLPRVALRQALLAAGLAHRVQDGVVYIFLAESDND